MLRVVVDPDPWLAGARTPDANSFNAHATRTPDGMIGEAATVSGRSYLD